MNTFSGLMQQTVVVKKVLQAGFATGKITIDCETVEIETE